MSISHALKSGGNAWEQIVNGGCIVNGRELEGGDGAAITNESEIEIAANHGSEPLLFEVLACPRKMPETNDLLRNFLKHSL
jgi:quercetin 2,3-dioxygenase